MLTKYKSIFIPAMALVLLAAVFAFLRGMSMFEEVSLEDPVARQFHEQAKELRDLVRGITAGAHGDSPPISTDNLTQE